MRKILTTAAMVWCYCSVEKNYTKVTLWLLIHAFTTRPNYRPITLERRQSNPAYIWHHGCEVILCVVRVSSGYTDTQPIVEDSFVAQSIFRSSCSSGKILKEKQRRDSGTKERRPGRRGGEEMRWAGIKGGDKTVGQEKNLLDKKKGVGITLIGSRSNVMHQCPRCNITHQRREETKDGMRTHSDVFSSPKNGGGRRV